MINEGRHLAAADRVATEYFEWQDSASKPSRHDGRIMLVSLVREELEREAAKVEEETLHAVTVAQLPYKVVPEKGAGDHEGLHYAVMLHNDDIRVARFKDEVHAQALAAWLNTKPKFGGGG